MKPKVYIASAIDEDITRGKNVREHFRMLVEECGCEALGAGFAGNPIIPTESPREVCKSIIRQDLMEQGKAHVTLGITNRKTFAVGTWIEVWEGYKLGQYIIIYVYDHNEVPSIFLKGIADEIIYDRNMGEQLLRDILESLALKVK